jgi:tape measure domain-containing protein
MTIFELLGTMNIAGMNETTSGLAALGGVMSGIGSAVKGVGETLTQNLTEPLIGFAKQGLQFNSTIEDLQTSFKVMLGSEEAAIKMTKDLKVMGAETPFEITGLAQATKTLLAFGYTQENVIPIMSRLGDVSLGNEEKLQGMSLVMGQINSLGRLQAGDLNQLIGRGWNPLNEITARTGETMEEVRERMRAGKVTYKEVEQALVDATDKGGKFYNGMAEGSKTLSGKLSTLADTFNDLLGKATKPLFDFLQQIAVPVLTNLIGFLANLPTPIIMVITAFDALLAGVGPILVVIGTLIGVLGGVVTAITAIVSVISTVGLPIIAAIVGGIVIWIAEMVMLVGVVTTVTVAITAFLAKLGFIGDAIATLKALFSGDADTMFKVLTERLGMSGDQARALADRFGEIVDKAQVVISVIRDNLSVAFGMAKDAISSFISDGLENLNGSTQTSQNIFLDFIKGIIDWGGQLFDYLYKLLDTFGLIPDKLKYANSEIENATMELMVNTQTKLDELNAMHKLFGENLNTENRNLLNQKLEETKAAMDTERNAIIEKYKERSTAELDSMKAMFAETDVISQERQAKLIEDFNTNVASNITMIQERDARILELEKLKISSSRELTAAETIELQALLGQRNADMIQTASDGNGKLISLYEELKNRTTSLARDEAIQIIAEANKTYDGVKSKAEKLYSDKVRTIQSMVGETTGLTQQEADSMIREAGKARDKTIDSATTTKNRTIALANEKAGGVLTAAEKETREVNTQAEKLKKLLEKLWDDLKKSLPSKMKEAISAVASAIDKNSEAIISAAAKVGESLAKKLVAKAIEYIKENAWKILSAVASILSGGIFGEIETNTPKNARGTRNWKGGLSWVGEQGPELINIPEGADIYSNPESVAMTTPITSSTINNNKTEGDIYNVSVIINPDSIEQIKSIHDLFANIKTEAYARGGAF